jgi:hypothetical protein
VKGELRPRAMAVSSSSIGDTDVGILPCRPQVKQIWTLFHENLYLDTVSTASSGPPDQELTVFQVLVGHDGGDGAIGGGVGDLAHRLRPDVLHGEQAGHGGLHARVGEDEASALLGDRR